MKKFGFIVPLMGVSLLASCGGSKPTEYITHKFTFHGTNCKINGDSEYSHDIYENDKNVQYTITPNVGYKLPETIDSDIPYDNKTGVITISEIKADIELSVTAVPEISPVATYTITFDAGDGKFLSGEQQISFKLDKGTKLLPYINQIQPTLESQTFAYYEYEEIDSAIDYDDVVTSDITLKANYFASNTPKTDDLTKFDWKTIKNISVTGDPSQWFNIGATKKVTVNEKDHTVRIIGFNHDALKSDKTKTAGITFEFANVITNNDGNADTTNWNSKGSTSPTNHKYSESTLNDYLNVGESCIFNKLPDELKTNGIIKEVYKPVAETSSYEINDTYTTKLFPLSYREITASGDSTDAKIEGSAYPFYTGKGYDTDDNRIKRKAGIASGDGEYNWLRSPDTSGSSIAWGVSDSGYLDCGSVYDSAFAVAPAFCI